MKLIHTIEGIGEGRVLGSFREGERRYSGNGNSNDNGNGNGNGNVGLGACLTIINCV